jgi:alcohol dehydrogenase class IV
VVVAQFNSPLSLIVGGGARKRLADQILKRGKRRVLVVTDAYMVASGKVQEFEVLLREADIKTSIFSKVQPDPTIENVEEGIAAYRDSQSELIVGIGGGSPMDAAKAISILTTNPLPLAQYMGYHKIPNAGCPLILVPTTAGTGSEATKVSVITDPVRNVKMMLLDAHLQAEVAIVDYELSVSMPKALTAHVGVDTFSHGLEAYVSRKANQLTDPIALSCMQLCSKYLIAACEDGNNMEAREGMMMAALQGGMAFSNSSVCLIHGMSRPLGAHFHLTHGLANAVLLPDVTKFSLEAAEARYAEISRTIGIVPSHTADSVGANALLPWLEHLNRRCGIPRMRELIMDRRVYESKLHEMAEAAIESGSPDNNPRVPTCEQIIDIYRSIW